MDLNQIDQLHNFWIENITALLKQKWNIQWHKKVDKFRQLQNMVSGEQS